MKYSRRFVTLSFLLTLGAGVQAQSAGVMRDVAGYGAKPDGKTLNTKAINQAISACSTAGGGTVVFPAGQYLSGSIELRQNVTLHLEAGAVIVGSTNLEDYALETAPGSAAPSRAGLLTARSASNIAITGRGIIEGNGMFFVDPVKLKLSEGSDYDKKCTRQGEDFMNPKYGTADGPLEPKDRPNNLLRFFNCTNILISGVTIQNSPIWTVHFVQCERVNITGVAINSFGGGRRVPNDDGIDLAGTRYVHISDCDIQNGDDGIVVLGGEKITVANCTLSSRSAAVRVGFAGADIRDCVFANLVIFDSNRGLAVNVRGASSIENVLFSDIVIQTRLVTGHWWGKGEPIQVSALPWDPRINQIGRIKNVRFRNITADSPSGIIVYGCEQSVIKDLLFQGVKVRINNSPLQQSYGGNFDLRGCRDVATAVFAHDIPAFYCRYADGVKIDGLEVEWADGLPSFFSHAIQFENFDNVDIDGFSGGPAHPDGGQAAIALSKGGHVSIRNSRAARGTGVFLSVADVVDGGLFVNNDLREARVICQPEKLPFQASGNLLPKEAGDIIAPRNPPPSPPGR
jgi:parallel beta-helix repeat protein